MRPVCRGPGWDGHLLLLYHDESQRRREIEAWVRRDIEPGDESPARSLSGLLREQPHEVSMGAWDASAQRTAPGCGSSLLAPQPHVDGLIRLLGVDREQGFLTGAMG